jgi:hypothetical protein
MTDCIEFAAFDHLGQLARIRLHATVVGVCHEGDPSV